MNGGEPQFFLVIFSAILFRLASFGFTPNRVAVLGANLIIMVHLARICVTYVALIRQRGGVSAIQYVVGTYRPVYAAWAAIVAFFLPVAFRFA